MLILAGAGRPVKVGGKPDAIRERNPLGGDLDAVTLAGRAGAQQNDEQQDENVPSVFYCCDHGIAPQEGVGYVPCFTL